MTSAFVRVAITLICSGGMIGTAHAQQAGPPRTEMLAQAGSAGGVIGKQGKSVSGDEEPAKPAPSKAAAPATQKPSEAKPSGCGKVVGVWTWTDVYNSVETYRADGTVVSTSNPQTGRWTCKGNQVDIRWADGKVERQTASSDFTKLHYVNPLGVASVGTKR